MRSSFRTSLAALGLCLVACGSPAENQDEKAGTKTSDAIGSKVLCQHVRDVAAKDSDDAILLDEVQRKCVTTMNTLEPRYAEFTKCVDKAQTASEIGRCELAMVAPPPLLAIAPSGGGKAGAVCDHMLTLLKEGLPEAGAMGPAEVAKLRAECVDKATKESAQQGEAVFAKKADCILAAQSLAEVQGCDPNRQ